MDLRARLLTKIDKRQPSECWLFTGARMKSRGYGKFAVRDGVWRLAHRVAFELFVRPIPKGKCVLHKCDNPPCCNWEQHLYVGTKKNNAEDREARHRRIPARGMKHGRRKLTTEQVREIRTSSATAKSLAKRFDVATSTVCRARLRIYWNHLDQ